MWGSSMDLLTRRFKLTIAPRDSGAIAQINNSASWEIDAAQRAKLEDFLYGAKNLRKFEAEGNEKGRG